VLSRIEPDKLKKRVFTAALIGPISLIGIYYGGWPFLIVMAVFFIFAQIEWFQLSRKLNEFMWLYPLGLIYICISAYCFYLIGIERSFAALLLLVLVIASDSGAYFAGKMIGGPKMAKKISPNKTWAGLGGAMLAPALAEVFFLDYNFEKGLFAYLIFVVFGMLIGLFCQVGDILVSLIKRKANVKDTGNILPGHGGILDRIDSLLMASLVFIALEFVMGHV
jgi:phosphatidate cytidylyltransferase